MGCSATGWAAGCPTGRVAAFWDLIEIEISLINEIMCLIENSET
jgi:hypothetical protein